MGIQTTGQQLVHIVSKDGRQIGLSVKAIADSVGRRGPVSGALRLGRDLARDIKLAHQSRQQDTFSQVKDELLLVRELGAKAKTGTFARQWYRLKTIASALFGKIRDALDTLKS